MDQIKKAIEIYEEHRKCKYHIKIENTEHYENEIAAGGYRLIPSGGIINCYESM